MTIEPLYSNTGSNIIVLFPLFVIIFIIIIIFVLISKKKKQIKSNEEQIKNEYINDDKVIYKNLEGAQKLLNVYSDRIELTQLQNIRAALSHNWTQGSKEIYYSDMSSVQFKEATNVLLGYIQFEVPGIASMSNFNSENSWTFDSNQNEISKKIVEYVRKRIREEKANRTSSGQTIIQSQLSTADEIKKFKELLDSGVITQEEFDAKKKQLLGL